jgi:hypothetical protein
MPMACDCRHTRDALLDHTAKLADKRLLCWASVLLCDGGGLALLLFHDTPCDRIGDKIVDMI